MSYQTDSSTAASTSNRYPTSVLVIASGLSLGLVWLLSCFTDLQAGTGWFPLSVHIAFEVFAIVVASLVFAVVWHSQGPQRASSPLLGCAFLAIALIDLAHMLSYNGMPDWITPASVEKAISFWLVSRILLACTLLAVAFRLQPKRPLSRPALLLVALAVAGITTFMQLYQPQLLPRTFIEGTGLTSFKIMSEWLIIALFVVAAWRFWVGRKERPAWQAEGLLAATLISIFAELCFIAYDNVNGLFSLLGHSYKILSYCFIYQVMFVANVRAPYARLAVEKAERDAAEKKAQYLSSYDSLTGLPKPELLQERTRQALMDARGQQASVAVLYVDFDHFKMVNDSFGHAFGDRLLCRASERLQQLLPESAMLARAGGDEFLVLLTELTDAGATSAVVQALLKELSEPFVLDWQSIVVPVSIGVALGPNDGQDFPTLLRNAEMAMYKAKQGGRKSCCYYDSELDAEMRGRLYLVNGLRLALSRNELLLHYQPQVDIATGRLLGVEALVRWQHPQWGLVLPGRFIPAAEENGLIVEIGSWVLFEACSQAASWRAQGMMIPRVAVNVAAAQLHDGSLERVVQDALAKTGLPASALELELTESSLLENDAEVVLMLNRLKALGIQLSIDDFGTGYSCLAYLRQLAVDTLKIDRSFVQGIDTEDGHAIVATIIQMADSLGLSTLAEGVEDQAIANELLRLGCRQAQGYLYARPVPAQELSATLAAIREQVHGSALAQ
ncbi:bifunctional diguanylate cyclase/phosphodiesterase [Stutzerimonas stutzeri]|uniref:bifunctional diguanylate cyclase/phosphodiesterase n=1 Tax=Stutzerimonas stutzeri TaxID=316 RepID=UPI00265B42B7|nr:EAL domain-containing protein [Stutzerimonas stutzeri]MCF6781412.1 EAL domain-containing protein [Stutzerimonas stutzeri]MCF6806577.1 EAL domain-containing protein [Stutzerimonas stutzeri]